MKSWAYQQQNAFVGSSVQDGVVCPKPRKVGVPIRLPSRLIHINNQPGDACDSNAGMELLDIIQRKGNYGPKRSNFQVASSPPFFIGSPPSRASNPVIQDEQFGNDYDNPPSSRKTGGCVRIEGFNCRGNSSISTLA